MKKGKQPFFFGVHGIGVDCEDLDRFKGSVNNPRFVSKILSKKELNIFQKKGSQKIHFLAGRFVAKEAIIKATSRFLSRLSMPQIDISTSQNLPPFVSIEHNTLKNRNIRIDLSIAHSRSTAVAFCLVFDGRHEI